MSAFWNENDRSKIRPDLIERLRTRLSALNQASKPEEMNVPGFNFHRLRGTRMPRYTIHLNGPWCVTFEWRDEDAVRVDLEQYH